MDPLYCARPAYAQQSPSSQKLVVPLASSAPNTSVIDESWASATTAELGWDFAFRRAPERPARAALLRHGDFLFVAFSVRQREPVTATQRTNGSGVDQDDEVSIYLWPDGPNGFVYRFSANPLGTHYQTSSENTVFTPDWLSTGHVTAAGYDVILRVPLGVLRAQNTAAWTVQLERRGKASGADDEWAHAAGQDDVANANYAGRLVGVTLPFRINPRLQFYGLSEAASPAAGGPTSRSGLDLALPFTRTASFLATFHPDYSNVEIDQQTIVPNEFPRQYSEVRPFFTQGSSFYNTTYCISCTYQILYTPAIPTFREGYAIEGKAQGLGFAAFDAIGGERSDMAGSLNFSNAIRSVHATVEVVRALTPTAADTTVLAGANLTNQYSHLSEYVTVAHDGGGAISDSTDASLVDAGAGISGANSFVGFAVRRIGAGFSPRDGYVQNAGVAGWAANGNETIPFGPTAALRSISLSGSIDRYHDGTGQLAQTDQDISLAVSTRTLLTFSATSGSSYLRLSSGEFTPFTQNGLGIGFRDGTATPTDVNYDFGRYARGLLRSWFRSSTFRLAKRATMTLEADDTDYVPDDGTFTKRQWLERAAIGFQPSARISFDVGVRRIIGTQAPTAFTALPEPVNASNVTFALHTLGKRDEVYLVYGNPNDLSTFPALIFKVVHYIGAAKGT
jgi:hypothetical protein